MQKLVRRPLYLTSIDGTREPMDDAKIEFLAPLLAVQRYITGVRTWQGESIEYDFTVVRHLTLISLTSIWPLNIGECANQDDALDG